MHPKIMSVFLLVIVFAGNPAFCEESEFRATIRGKISNFDDVGQYISEATHLRLYPCETIDKLNVQMNKEGKLVPSSTSTEQKFYFDGFKRLVPPSELPAVGLPFFGDFKFFKVRGLKPGGCYKICVMMLDPPYDGMVDLTDGDGKPVEIIIPEPEEPGRVPTVNLAKTPLRIPKPGKR